MLQIVGLSKAFGGLKALDGLSLTVAPGEIFGLIGPNGSGKTTTINVLTGVYRPGGGRVVLGDQDITGCRPEVIARAGLARTFQNLRLFGNRSVLDNIRTAQNVHCRSILARLGVGDSERVLLAEAKGLVNRLGLLERTGDAARHLSYGEKKRLEIARALALRPKFLLLDEPAAGMNPVELDWLAKAIREIGASGIGIVLIEHHMKLVMSVCHRIAVLNFGQMIANGTAEKVVRDADVIEAYLGRVH